MRAHSWGWVFLGSKQQGAYERSVLKEAALSVSGPAWAWTALPGHARAVEAFRLALGVTMTSLPRLP